MFQLRRYWKQKKQLEALVDQFDMELAYGNYPQALDFFGENPQLALGFSRNDVAVYYAKIEVRLGRSQADQFLFTYLNAIVPGSLDRYLRDDILRLWRQDMIERVTIELTPGLEYETTR